MNKCFVGKQKKALRNAMKSIESIVVLALEFIVSVNEETRCDSLSASNIEVFFVEHKKISQRESFKIQSIRYSEQLELVECTLSAEYCEFSEKKTEKTTLTMKIKRSL